MELSTNICYLRKRRGTTQTRTMAECAEIVKKAGFNFIDYSGSYYLEQEDWQEQSKRDLETFNRIGLTVDQTHAPYNFSAYDEETYKECMQRAFEINNIVGSKNIVIHADKYVPDENGFDFNKALKEIYDFYAPYVEYAKKEGFGVAIENLFDRPDGIRTRFTSYVEEQKAIIEKFNDPCVTACWDFGHGKVSYGDKHFDALKSLGSLVTSTHVHDNISGQDLHQNIFLGNADWEEIIKYMKESGYSGKFTFEMVYGVLPDALVQKYMDLFYETGEYLLSI